jgi:hypothetical protein
MRTISLRYPELPPIVVALAAQLAALFVVAGATWVGGRFFAIAMPSGAAVWCIGAAAAAIGAWWGLARWWWLLQLFLAPAIVWGLQWALPPWIYLAAFLAVLVVMKNSAGDRVPLYLSSEAVWEAVAGLLPRASNPRFVDLGSGLGGGLCWLAPRYPRASLVGVENAPLLWAISRLRLRRHANARIERGSLWNYPLSEADVVYAFLSPAPMTRLWHKARSEMRPGTLFVSNSFAVPGVEPDTTLQLRDRRGSRLYVWRM